MYGDNVWSVFNNVNRASNVLILSWWSSLETIATTNTKYYIEAGIEGNTIFTLWFATKHELLWFHTLWGTEIRICYVVCSVLGIEALCFPFVSRFIAFCLGFLCCGGIVCCEGTEGGGRSFLGCDSFFDCFACFGGGGFVNIYLYSGPAIYINHHNFIYSRYDIDVNHNITRVLIINFLFRCIEKLLNRSIFFLKIIQHSKLLLPK